MIDRNPYTKKSIVFFRIAVVCGCVMEITIALIACLIAYKSYACYIFMMMPIIFHAFRFFAMAMAITEKTPWRISATERPYEPERLLTRPRNPIFEFFGFRRQFSCARSFCGTRDFHGFYGLWCFFAKPIHQSIYITFIIAYVITSFFVSFSFWVFPRILIAQLITLFVTAYYDYYVSYQIVCLAYKKKTYVTKEKETNDALLLEILEK